MTKKIKVCCEYIKSLIKRNWLEPNAYGRFNLGGSSNDFCLNVTHCPFCGVKIELEEEKPKEPYCYGETCKHYAGQTTGVLNLIACNKRKDNEYGFVPFNAKCGDYEPKPKPKVKKRWYVRAYKTNSELDDDYSMIFKDEEMTILKKDITGFERDIKLEPETNRLYIETDSE